MQTGTHGAAMAALSLCESILLSLTENKIISEAEAKAIVADAAAAHRAAVPLSGEAGADHAEAADILEEIMQHGDSVLHADR